LTDAPELVAEVRMPVPCHAGGNRIDVELASTTDLVES
jgi:hypothetical protein